MLRKFSGAIVRRTIDRSHARVPEHAHDWPMLSIFVMGEYANRTEIGEKYLNGPSAVFYRASAAHRNVIGPVGFEQIEIEFDPNWLRLSSLPNAPVTHWTGGWIGAEARQLARRCFDEIAEEQLRGLLRRYIELAVCQRQVQAPNWVHTIQRRLRAQTIPTVSELANELGLHPSWIGEAYHRACGERLQETAARIRVERAARLLRETNQSLAFVALEAGFCDQSHMNRTFRRVLGRPPLVVRQERRHLRQSHSFRSQLGCAKCQVK